MYQDLTGRVDQVFGRQDDIFDYLKNGLVNGNGVGLTNDNGNWNGDGYSDETIGIASPTPANPTTFSHQGYGAPLERMQRHSGGCDQEIEWDGLP